VVSLRDPSKEKNLGVRFELDEKKHNNTQNQKQKKKNTQKIEPNFAKSWKDFQKNILKSALQKTEKHLRIVKRKSSKITSQYL
jgi:hypothetical protein